MTGDRNALRVVRKTVDPFVWIRKFMWQKCGILCTVLRRVLWKSIRRMVGFRLSIDLHFIWVLGPVVVQFDDQLEVFNQLPLELQIF